jgi:hypothetical protein
MEVQRVDDGYDGNDGHDEIMESHIGVKMMQMIKDPLWLKMAGDNDIKE